MRRMLQPPFAALCLAAPAHANPERQAQARLDALREASGVPGMSAAVWQAGTRGR
jgi:hypothetical protein